MRRRTPRARRGPGTAGDRPASPARGAGGPAHSPGAPSNGVIKCKGVTHELPNVRVPTPIVVGEEDVATVPAKAERLHQLIPGSRLVRLPREGHSDIVEEPALVNAPLGTFLAAQAQQTPPKQGDPGSMCRTDIPRKIFLAG